MCYDCFPIIIFHNETPSRCLGSNGRTPCTQQCMRLGSDFLSETAASQKMRDRVCLYNRATRRSLCLYDPDRCCLRMRREVACTRPVPCVNRLRTACTRPTITSLPKNIVGPGEKDQIWTTSYATRTPTHAAAIVYEGNIMWNKKKIIIKYETFCAYTFTRN